MLRSKDERTVVTHHFPLKHAVFGFINPNIHPVPSALLGFYVSLFAIFGSTTILPNKVINYMKTEDAMVASALFMSWGIENNTEIAKETLICTYLTNAGTSFCLASSSEERGKVAGLNHRPGGFQLPALFGVRRGLSAHHQLVTAIASLSPVSIVRQDWI